MAVDEFKSSDGARWTTRVTGISSRMISLCFLGAVLISLLMSGHYSPGVVDDALISYRYSDRFLHGKGLTWNDGEFVEGYSNLLWVLIVATGGLIQSNLVVVGWILGAIANVATIASIPWAFGRAPNASIPAVIGGLLLIAGSEAFAFWAIGGMETALLCTLLSWALAMAYRASPGGPASAARWSSLLFGLLAITRPDGILFGIGAGIGELIRSGLTRTAVKRAVGFAGTATAFAAMQVAFRIVYYGSSVPNTASVKISFNFDRLLSGGMYVARGSAVNAAVIATMLVATIAAYRSRGWQTLRGLAVFLMPGIIWLAYIFVIGGDFFPFERHWQPAFICFVFATSSVLALLSPTRHSLLCSLVATIVTVHVAAQATVNPYELEFPPSQTRKFEETLRREIRKVDADGRFEQEVFSRQLANRSESLRNWHNDYQQCIEVGRTFYSAFREIQPLLAVNLAGCLPYQTEFPAIDMLGLTDYHIAHHLPSDFGHGLLGHELGDGVYVLSRSPDFIIFCPFGDAVLRGIPCFRSDREIAASPDFRKYYRLVFYRSGTFEIAIWTRVESSRIGIRRTDDRIYIPGFLLATTSKSRSVLGSAGALVTRLENGEARIEGVYLPPGTWDVTLETEEAGHLALTAFPITGTTVLNPKTLRIATQGDSRSFIVVGDQGLIRAVVAYRIGTAAIDSVGTR